MKTYREHYEVCRRFYNGPIIKDLKYRNLYDLTVDASFLENRPEFAKLINEICPIINDRFDKRRDVVEKEMAIYLNNWREIEQLEKITEIITSEIEQRVFHSNCHVEFLHIYENKKNVKPLSSWLWHYDDCPQEFVKFIVYLNEVNENNGCFSYLEDENGNANVIQSYRTSPYLRSFPQIYPKSRIPKQVIKNKLENGWQIKNLIGQQGTNALLSPNIYHRATVPNNFNNPRQCMFFYIRPSIKKRSVRLAETFSVLPEKNVKRYDLD